MNLEPTIVVKSVDHLEAGELISARIFDMERLVAILSIDPIVFIQFQAYNKDVSVNSDEDIFSHEINDRNQIGNALSFGKDWRIRLDLATRFLFKDVRKGHILVTGDSPLIYTSHDHSNGRTENTFISLTTGKTGEIPDVRRMFASWSLYASPDDDEPIFMFPPSP